MLMRALLALLFLLPFLLPAQQQAVTVKREIKTRQDVREAIYTADNKSFSRQTIYLELNGGSYKRADSGIPVVRTITPGTNRLLTLSDVNGTPGYGYTYAGGCLNTKHKDVIYLLPVAPGKSTRIDTLSNLHTKYFGRQQPLNWTSYSMTASPGDTIFASRRGIVSWIKTDEGERFESGVAYSTFHTTLQVEHEDCTRASYKLIDKDRLLVKPGDRVEAGEPLGIVEDGEEYTNGCHLRFTLYYPILTKQVMKSLKRDRNFGYSFQYITPEFAGFGSVEPRKEYVSTHPEKAIFQEMSKRDIKKYKKARAQR